MNATPLPLLTAAALCGARNRAGMPCRCPAMRGKARCRLHGGKSPGAPKGEANGNWRQGAATNEAKETKAKTQLILKNALRQLKAVASK